MNAKELLLDAAEELFAVRGYFGVSVRDITKAASVQLGAVNYHFGSKEKLFEQVARRRAEELGQARLDALAALPREGGGAQARVEGIVRAFVEPVLERWIHGGQGWRNYCTLVAHMAATKMWVKHVVATSYDPYAEVFIRALRELFPDAPEFEIQCCFQFLLSNTLYTLCDNRRLDGLSKGRYSSSDVERIAQPLVRYMCGGILATVRQTPPVTAPGR